MLHTGPLVFALSQPSTRGFNNTRILQNSYDEWSFSVGKLLTEISVEHLVYRHRCFYIWSIEVINSHDFQNTGLTLHEKNIHGTVRMSWNYPVTVTTRIVPFLVENPYRPSFVTVTGWGVDHPCFKITNPWNRRWEYETCSQNLWCLWMHSFWPIDTSGP